LKPAPFDYVRPASIAAALEVLSEHGSDAKVLAGGQSLMPMLAFRMATPRVLVDIGGLAELKAVTSDADGLSLGALVRWCDIERNNRIAGEQPLLAEAIRYVAHYQIRNRGTVGGSLAHADPAAELPAIALACHARIVVAGRKGSREIAASDFFTGALTTALDPDELIVAMRLPPWPQSRRWAFQEFSRRKGDFALAGVALYFHQNSDGGVVEPSIVGFGIADKPVRLASAEDVIRNRTLDEQAFADALGAAANGIDISSDIHAPADYRAALLGTLLERALRRAVGL
jgi:aerobic carbon-monoxide dehydrogenase medium subunit